jgi:fermentation-respiration switch protein FrsA (DUF1100 family)
VPITQNPSSLGLTYKSISFTSRGDKLALEGWYLESGRREPTIVMVHGSEGNRVTAPPGALELARSLVEEGFSVLMFDLRGHGESEGARLSAGYNEKRDLLGAVDYLEDIGVRKIGVLGFSLGAAIAILATAEEPRISAVVSDSSFADLTEIINREAKRRSSLPGWFTPGYLLMLKLMYDIDLNAVRPVDAVAEIAPRSIFFIHGKADAYIPPVHVYSLYKASNNPSNPVWLVPDAGHIESYKTAPVEYVKRVTTFFERKLSAEN